MLEEILLEESCISSKKLLLINLGDITNSLLDSHVELWAIQQARKMVKLVCDSAGVDYENGEFRVFIDEQGQNDLTEDILRLAQACIRVCYVSCRPKLKFLVKSILTLL